MACTLNIKTDNGADSILFQDITTVTGVTSEAVNLYYFTKTEEFKNVYGDYTKPGFDKNKLDFNGEPKYDSFSKEAFLDDKMYSKVELDNRASIYKTLLEQTPKIKVLLSKRLDYLKGSKSKLNMTAITALENLLNSLNTEPINVSIPKFIETSSRHVSKLLEASAEIYKNPKSEFKELNGIYKVSQTYSIIAELKAELLTDNEIQQIFGMQLDVVNQILADINSIRSRYLNKAMDFLVEEFHKRDKTWSRDAIRKILKVSPGDISGATMMVEWMGDAPDRALGAVAEIMKEAEHAARKESIVFNKRLEDKLGEMEKAGVKPQTIFNNIITTKGGELHILDINLKHSKGKYPKSDAEYNKVQALSKESYEFLQFFSNEYEILQKVLPGHASMGTRLPSVLKGQFELLEGKSLQEGYQIMADYGKRQLLKTNTEMEKGMILDATGKPVQKIPVFYTQKYDTMFYKKAHKKYLAENIAKGMHEINAEELANTKAIEDATKQFTKSISRDLIHSLQAFHTMAVNYAQKNERIHIFEAASAIIGSEMRKYEVRGAKTATNARELISGTETNAARMLKKFLEIHLYGQKELDLGTVGETSVDLNSVLRLMNSATSFIQMGVNILAGVSNVGVGEFNNILEGMGGEFFTIGNYKKATSMYMKHLPKLMSDIGQRTPKNLVNLLSEEYDILQGYHKDMKASEKATWKRLMSTNMVFFMHGIGEHFLQTRGGLAMLENITVYDKVGTSKGSLLDNHSVKAGKLERNKGLYIKDSSGKLVVLNNLQVNKISNRIGAVLRAAQGNYSSNTKTAAHQDGRLALLMKFRGWLPEGFKKRFAPARHNTMLGRETTGFYRDGIKNTAKLMNDIRKLQFNLAREDWRALTAHEKANIRRLITETVGITSLAIGGILLSGMGKYMKDEYDSDSLFDRGTLGAYQFLNYEVNRMFTELAAYTSPVEFIKLMRSPAPSISILETTWKALNQLREPFEVYDAGLNKDKNKFLVKSGRMVPIYKHLSMMSPEGIEEKSKWFIND